MSQNVPDSGSDEALMLAFAEGSISAFDQLYQRHRKGLYAFVARQFAGQAICVDDIFQDVWLAVARSRAQYRPQAKFRTWLFQIARNRAIDLLRANHPASSASNDGSFCDDPFEFLADTRHLTPEHALDSRQKAEAISRALAALPTEQREAFLLREHSEMSLEEIAHLTGVSPETAKSRLRYAVNKLRAALRGIWP